MARADGGAPEGLRAWILREVKVGELLPVIAVAGPVVAAFLFLRETALLGLSLIAISILIPARKLKLGVRDLALQFLAILGTFGVLFIALPVKPLFVSLTAVAAFLTVAVTRYGNRLNTMGRWVFIPGLYLACEVHDGSEAMRHAVTIIALSPLVLGLVSLVQVLDTRGRRQAAVSAYGPVAEHWLVPAIATALAVLAAAALVEALDLAMGQWVIWSAASVVVGDLSASAGKLKLRAIGALVGAPLGLLVGLALPESRIGYCLAVLATVLTLVAFDRYVVSFAARCFFIALAAAFCGGDSAIAEERVANVLVGGAFGIISVALTEIVARRLARRADAGGAPERAPP